MNLLGVIARRLRPQRLLGAGFERPEDVVGWLGAVQSQDYLAAKWAVAQRTANPSDAELEDAFTRGAILRTHVLRPTWHFVRPADIRWMLELTAPRVNALNATYYRQVGLDARALARGDEALAGALQGGKQLTRAELAQALRAAELPTQDLRLALLVMHAELAGAICSGPRRGKQFTYAALDERAPLARPLTRDEALAELARRYFRSHGPALARELAWWSGLPIADATRAIAMLGGELRAIRCGDHTFWASAAQERPARRTAARVYLLPNFDEYLVSCRDHAANLDARLSRSLAGPDSILASHVVDSSGRVIGDWRRTLKRDAVTVHVQPSAPLDEGQRAALTAEVARYGRFLGLRAQLMTMAGGFGNPSEGSHHKKWRGRERQ